MTYYKWLTEDHKGTHSGFDFTPYLPEGSRPGKWLPKIKTLEMCSSGYHVAELEQWRNWRNTEMYEVEVRGNILVGDNKTAHQQMRFVRKIDAWNKATLVTFAVKCAERTLKNYEAHFPNDDRPRKALKAATDYMAGNITLDQLNDAIEAAWSAAESARSAAWSAAESAWSAWSAAESAAWSARSAAWSAAESAAWSAAESARSAAWSARSAEANWQDKQLRKLLGLQ